MFLRKSHFLALGLAAATFAACGGEDDHGVAGEFCEHFQTGPFQTVTASLDAASAPDASFEHTRVNVTLTSTTGGNGGYISFEAEEAGEFLFAVSADAPLVITQGGTTVEREATAGNECTEVVRMDTYDLEAGTYTVWLGATSETEIGFGHEEAGEEHAHE